MEAISLIGPNTEALLLENQDNFLVPADNVATVMYQHSLDHALLVLTNVGYSKIPVLDKDDRFMGLIGLNDIVQKMVSLTTIDTDHLAGLTVADVMEIGVDTVREDAALEDILHLLVNNAFLPMVDDQRIFLGIITRKEILKCTNHLVHELERQYLLVSKQPGGSDTEIATDGLKVS